MNSEEVREAAIELVQEHLQEGLDFSDVYESERAEDEEWSDHDMKRIYDVTFKVLDELAASL
nr:hypothetical protein [Rhodococcus sp. (in: high G+C Gram-positive bacteria)]